MEIITDIDTSTRSGQLLFAAIMKIAGQSLSKNPSSVFLEVMEHADVFTFNSTQGVASSSDGLAEPFDMNPITFKVMKELASAERAHPQWPTDLVHQTSIMVEEAGEALREANNMVIDKKPINMEAFKAEVVQTAAMCLRILKNL